jgi:putative transposase
MTTQAQWLQREHPDAAALLREGLQETFTVNALGLPPSLTRCLCTTNIIEKPNGIVRRTSRRVTRYRDAEMALRWIAAGFIDAQKSFRKIQGITDLWILKAAVGRLDKQLALTRSSRPRNVIRTAAGCTCGRDITARLKTMHISSSRGSRRCGP